MSEFRVLSFDLEGTLVDLEFSRLVWEKGVPALYAEERHLSPEEALRRVMEEYAEVGPERVEWYDLRYWFRRFGFKRDWWELLERYRGHIRTYPEVEGVLQRLSAEYDLIIVSNTCRDFLDLQIRGLRSYFTRIFSAPTDFGMLKSPELFTKICRKLGLRPQEMVHIGDVRRFDFEAPRAVGITAFLLDRSGKGDDLYIVRDLEEFEERLTELRGLSL